ADGVRADAVDEFDIRNSFGQVVEYRFFRACQMVFGFKQPFTFLADDEALGDIELGFFDPEAGFAVGAETGWHSISSCVSGLMPSEA
ncbi:hypothetical protein NEIPOLOT_00207, partial [Neisseria polysaccharea ATCC 43768]